MNPKTQRSVDDQLLVEERVYESPSATRTPPPTKAAAAKLRASREGATRDRCKSGDFLPNGTKLMSKTNFAKKHGRAVLPGQLWIDIHNIERRVMTVAEGYAMVRAKGCSPFTVPIKAMDDEWRLSQGKGESHE